MDNENNGGRVCYRSVYIRVELTTLSFRCLFAFCSLRPTGRRPLRRPPSRSKWSPVGVLLGSTFHAVHAIVRSVTTKERKQTCEERLGEPQHLKQRLKGAAYQTSGKKKAVSIAPRACLASRSEAVRDRQDGVGNGRMYRIQPEFNPSFAASLRAVGREDDSLERTK